MKKNYSAQKKKTVENTISRILFKILIAIAVIIFAFIIIDRANFSSGSLDFKSTKSTSVNEHTPSQLRWFNDFKGVENLSKKSNDKKSSNSSSGNTGFKFEGFKK